MAEQAPFYLFITFVLAYGEKHLQLNRNDLLNDTLIAAAIGFVSVPLFGFLSDIFGRRRVYGTGIVLVGLFAFPYYGLLNSKESGLILLAIVVSLVLHDIMYGPQAALISETFGTGVRYSGAGLGYQLASVIAGGPAPLIATAILARTGASTWISGTSSAARWCPSWRCCSCRSRTSASRGRPARLERSLAPADPGGQPARVTRKTGISRSVFFW